MTEFNVSKAEDPDAAVSLSGCSRCQAFWFDRGELEQLRLSFSGKVREPMKVARPSGAISVGADPFAWGADGAVDIGSMFDGFDFDCGD